MSLFKKLWIAIWIIIVLSLGGSFVLMTISAKNYLEIQLTQKNTDTVNTLALSLTTNGFDPVFAELQVAALFDSGHYHVIKLEDPTGNRLINAIDENNIQSVPNWFIQGVSISPQAGVAQVNDGWQQIGQLYLMSSTQFAYIELWRNTIRLGLYFLIVGILSGVLCHYFLKRILLPLKDVIEQSNALENRQYITVEEPNTLEFRQLVASMNRQSRRVKAMLDAESERIQLRHQEKLFDPLTGFFNRTSIIEIFESITTRDDQTASGVVIAIRMTELVDLNKEYGREKIDQLIKQFSDAIHQFEFDINGISIGRLNAAEFLLILPAQQLKNAILKNFYRELKILIASFEIKRFEIKMCITNYLAKEEFSSLSIRLEQGLDQQEQLHYLEYQADDLPRDKKGWLRLFNDAFAAESFQLDYFPVRARELAELHYEAPIRMLINNNKVLNAGRFLGWAERTEKIAELDFQALKLAILSIEKASRDISINISTSSLTDRATMDRMIEFIGAHKAAAKHLWMEIPESGVYFNLDEFKHLAAKLNLLGCKLGIEHAGHMIDKIGSLHDIGIDYLKVDSVFIKNIDSNTRNQCFLQGMVAIAHSIGVLLIAEGVQSEAEQNCLWHLGFDGVTGPIVPMDSDLSQNG